MQSKHMALVVVGVLLVSSLATSARAGTIYTFTVNANVEPWDWECSPWMAPQWIQQEGPQTEGLIWWSWTAGPSVNATSEWKIIGPDGVTVTNLVRINSGMNGESVQFWSADTSGDPLYSNPSDTAIYNESGTVSWMSPTGDTIVVNYSSGEGPPPDVPEPSALAAPRHSVAGTRRVPVRSSSACCGVAIQITEKHIEPTKMVGSFLSLNPLYTHTNHRQTQSPMRTASAQGSGSRPGLALHFLAPDDLIRP